jgi:hypothetical protein
MASLFVIFSWRDFISRDSFEGGSGFLKSVVGSFLFFAVLGLISVPGLGGAMYSKGFSGDALGFLDTSFFCGLFD